MTNVSVSSSPCEWYIGIFLIISFKQERLKAMDPSSHEHGPLVDYLTWLTSLPWGLTTHDNLDLKHAKGKYILSFISRAYVSESIFYFSNQF